MEHIDTEIAKRGWSRNELARRAGLSASAFSLIAKGARGIGPEVCRKVASVLHVPETEVMQWAGLLDTPVNDPDLAQVNHKFQLLPPDKRKQVEDFLDFLLSKDE